MRFTYDPFANQTLSGFPQSIYICALVYGFFALFRALVIQRHTGSWRRLLTRLGALGVSAALGGAAGAVVLLPLSQLGSVSDRAARRDDHVARRHEAAWLVDPIAERSRAADDLFPR